MVESVCILFTHAPYGNAFSYEGVRLAVGLSSMGMEQLGLMFFDEAIHCITKNHKTTNLGVFDIKKLLFPIIDLDVKVFACKHCLAKYGLKEEDLDPDLNPTLVDEVMTTLDNYKTVIRM